MATVTLTVEAVVDEGLTPTRTGSLSTSNTYRFANDGRTLLQFEKSGTGNCSVTLTTPGTVGGLAIENPAVTVGGTTGDKFIGPFATNLYNDEDGYLSFSLSDILGLTVAVLRV